MPESSTTIYSAGRHESFLRHGISPELCIALLMGAQLLIWTLVPLAVGTSLPLDVVSDGLGWGHEWQWGYYKHPPLPSWEVEASFDALGDLGPYLLSQICIALTYLFVFLLGRELMEAKWAAAGTALAACIYYFSIPTPEFNHNIAQMPLWAAIIYTYHCAIRTSRLHHWVLLGALAGLALLTKYASAVLLATIGIHILLTSERRALFRTPGPYGALAACVLVVSPHLAWLHHNHFPTLAYAQRRAGQTASLAARMLAPLRFLLSQLLDISPVILLSAVAGLLGRPIFQSKIADNNLRFLITFTIGPAALTACLSLVTGLGLRDMWGAPMWNLTGLLVVYAAKSRWAKVSLRRLTVGVVAAFVLLPIAYVLASSTIPALRGRPSRMQWPDRAMARTLDDAWRRETTAPLRIVAADGWLAGLVAMRTPQRPSVFTDGDVREAQWITPDRLSREGALVLWRADKPVPASLARLPRMKTMGIKQFSWPGLPKVRPLMIGWGIIPPHSASKDLPDAGPARIR